MLLIRALFCRWHLVSARRVRFARGAQRGVVFAFVVVASAAIQLPWIASAQPVGEAGVAPGVKLLRIATLAPQRRDTLALYDHFRTELAKHSDGKVALQVFMGGAAGDERTVANKMRVGQLDGAMLTSVGLGAIVPQVLVLQVPGLVTTYEELDRVRLAMGPEFEDLFRKAGYELIAWGDAGKLRMFSSDPIARPKDLQSTKFWVWSDSPLMDELARVAKAPAKHLGVPEVLAGLETGMIDTVVASSLAVVGLQWHTRMKYMSSRSMGVLAGAFVVRKDVYDNLPKEVRKYMEHQADEFSDKYRKLGRDLDEEATKALAKRLKVVDWSGYQRAWDHLARQAREGFIGRAFSRELMERVDAVVTAP